VNQAGWAAAIRHRPGTLDAIVRVFGTEPEPMASVPASGLWPIASKTWSTASRPW
jgi:hypothetical protein